MSILISQDTAFIVQGITGREAVNLTRENLDYGAKIVGGVTPGRGGSEACGVPVTSERRPGLGHGIDQEGLIHGVRFLIEKLSV